MARFDVYENPNEPSRKNFPYLLDLQSDLLDGLVTRVVAPLTYVTAKGRTIEHLQPRFRIKKRMVYLSTSELAGIPARTLGKRVTSLKDQRQSIISALDFLITGF
jgi:toxin CcdB